MLIDSKKWQYYGTPGYNGTLTMTWDHKTLQTQHVCIEVWGYNETGEVLMSLYHSLLHDIQHKNVLLALQII